MKFAQSKLIFSFILFCITTVATVVSYLQAHFEQPVSQSPTFLSHPLEISRLPASEPADNTKNIIFKVKAFCSEETQKFNSQAQSMVMLDLELCLEIKSQRHIWIQNKTNGFKAQIFNLKSDQYKTDFIQLNEGLNLLEIESVLKDGHKQLQKIEILRGS